MDKECGLADRILVGSNFVRDTFLAEGFPSEKLCVIPYGANVELFSPVAPAEKEQAEDGDFRVLFVGAIGQQKGVSYLLRAYEAFKGPGTKLTLIGNYKGDPDVWAPFRDSFVHVPHLPRIQLAEMYRQADVMLFPSLFEGLGLVVLEAMASGIPVITTPNGPATSYVMGRTGL